MAGRLRSGDELHVGGAVALFFGLKIALGLILIGASTEYLSVAGFVVFSQFFLFLALLATVSAAGVQNGLTRQIAAAANDAGAEHRAAAAAFRIWAATSLFSAIIATILGRSISQLLVGDASLTHMVPLVTVAAAGGGFGVIACAILNGRHHAPTSLVLQSIGLVVGGTLCIGRLLANDPAGAVLGYAAGPLATSVLAMIVLWRQGVRYVSAAIGQMKEIRHLLRYSAVFLAVAVIMPSTLFALRHVYREAFGTELLGYWLVANRVSDVTSQVLGLYMSQIFLPQATRQTETTGLRSLLLRTLLLGSTVMLGGWAVFMAGAQFFVGTFLSDAYIPAIPFISGYLLGDGLRVTSSLTIHLMLARGRLIASVGVEAGTAILLAAYVAGLAALGYAEAPYWAYPAAYATMALGLLFLARSYPNLKVNGYQGS